MIIRIKLKFVNLLVDFYIFFSEMPTQTCTETKELDTLKNQKNWYIREHTNEAEM